MASNNLDFPIIPSDVLPETNRGVAAGIRRSCTKLGLKKKQRKNADKCAEAVLKIRAIITNNDFEEYFKFHKHQQQLRNYPFFGQIFYKMAA